MPTRPVTPTRRGCLVALFGLAGQALCAGPARGHELPENRLTLVLRNGHHLALTLLIDYPETLHRTLAPQQAFAQFALACAAMPAADLQAQLQRAHARLQADTRLVLPDGSELPIIRWQWPDATQAQALMQQRVMAAVVAPGDHRHHPPTEIRAEARARHDLRELSVRLPAQLQRVLVVWSRPTQRWLDPGAASPPLRF